MVSVFFFWLLLERVQRGGTHFAGTVGGIL